MLEHDAVVDLASHAYRVSMFTEQTVYMGTFTTETYLGIIHDHLDLIIGVHLKERTVLKKQKENLCKILEYIGK